MTKRNKMKWYKKLLITVAAILGCIVLILGCGIGYLTIPVAGYYSISERAFKIPGLSEGLVPQGLCYDESSESFFITGYAKGKNSPVYIMDKDKKTKKVLLAYADGTPFMGHAGGISVHGDYVYVAGAESGLYVFSYGEVMAAGDGGIVRCKGVFQNLLSEGDPIKISFTTATKTQITIGEFFREENYKSLETHKFTTPVGDYNQALAVTYNFDSSAKFGIDPTPVVAYSLPDFVQGMCIDGTDMYLSTSYSLSFSHIYRHDMKEMKKIQRLSVNGTEVDLLACDSSTLRADLKIAPMSEEIEIVGGKMYVMCESASQKYIFGNLTGGMYCYAMDIKKF